MATTTPNFGWAVPTSTDLVKDGAVAIETLGDAIDASLLDLKGGTTNQVLAKNSNTDMDFKWVSDATGMTNPMTTTGDTIYSSSGSTPARLGIGSTGQVLTVAGGVPTWAAASGGGPTGFTLLNAGGTLLTGAATITVSGISAKKLMVIVTDASSVSAGSFFSFRLNGDSGLNYTVAGARIDFPSTYAASMGADYAGYSGTDGILFARMSGAAASYGAGSLFVDMTDTTGWKPYSVMGGADASGNNSQRLVYGQGIYEASAAITSVSVISDTGNFDGGRIYVLGAN